MAMATTRRRGPIALLLLLLAALIGIALFVVLSPDDGAGPVPGGRDAAARDDDTSAPLDLINSLPSAMLIRVHADEPSSAARIRASAASAVVARGGLDPARKNAAARSALGGAYRLISLPRDAYLACPSIDPFAEARPARDPALTSSISILGPPPA